jgi:ABC-type Fe3+ transport system substrate-binding protein
LGEGVANHHALGANVRNFTNAASQIPKDVAIGEVAYGLAIDFYAWAQVKDAGPDKIGFVMPDNLTIITPDGIGILKGAANLAVAQAFIRFMMSEEGQKLWLLNEKAPDGPQPFNSIVSACCLPIRAITAGHCGQAQPIFLAIDLCVRSKVELGALVHRQ